MFFLANDGFFAFDGQQLIPIGSEKVNDFFLEDFDSNYADRMSAAVDPLNEVAMWSYTSTASPSGQPDKIIMYNFVLGKWSIAEIEADYLAPIFSSGYTVDALDNLAATVDALTIQLDDRFYKGGQYVFGGAYGDKIYAFSGAPLQATIETAEAPVSMGKHSMISRVYPYYEDGNVTVSIGTRDTQSATPTFSSAVSPNDDGFSPFRANGRYHRARLVLSDGWKKSHRSGHRGQRSRAAMSTTNFRILNPILATTREIAEIVNRTVDGKLNSTGDFTLTASATTTTVTDPRAGKESVILFSPTTSNAAAAISGLYVSTKTMVALL